MRLITQITALIIAITSVTAAAQAVPKEHESTREGITASANPKEASGSSNSVSLEELILSFRLDGAPSARQCQESCDAICATSGGECINVQSGPDGCSYSCTYPDIDIDFGSEIEDDWPVSTFEFFCSVHCGVSEALDGASYDSCMTDCR